MTTTAKPIYGASNAMTITLASLATSSGFTVGRQSTLVDNTTDLALEAQVQFKIKTGTTPTANTLIKLYLIGSTDGTLIAGAAGASDAGFTPSPDPSVLVYLDSIPNLVTTTGLTYISKPYLVANSFGGFIPKKWGVWVTHNLVAALDATGGSFSVTYTILNVQSV